MRQDFYDAMYQIEKEHWWFRAKQKIVTSILDKYLALRKGEEQLRLLDAGCGCGLMLNTLQQYGEVEGIDFSDTAIQYCQRSFKGRLKQWDLNNPLKFEHSFDVIIALDVLEHVENDHRAMQTLGNGLADGGIAIITVPANPWMWSKHDAGCMHQRRYTKKSLQKVCESASLTTCYLSYYNFWLFFPIASMRIAKSILPFLLSGNKSIENKIPPEFINRFLYRIFQSEHKAIVNNRRFPLGVSLIAVLRKDNTKSSI